MRMMLNGVGAAGWAAVALATAALGDDLGEVAADGALEDARWAFTLELSTSEARVIARFDPSRPAEDRWRLIEPADQAALTPDEEGLFNSMVSEPHADLALTFRTVPDGEAARRSFDLSRLSAARGALLRSQGENDVYAVDATAFETEDNRDFIGELSGEVSVDRESEAVNSFRMFAERSFKPHPLARLREFDMTMQIDELTPGGPRGVVGVHMRLSGSAMFQRFEEAMTTTNSDFQVAAVADDQQLAE